MVLIKCCSGQSRVSQKPELSPHQSSSGQPGLKTKKSKGLLDMISTRLRAQTPTEDRAATPAAEHSPRKSAPKRVSASVARRNTRSGPSLENEFTSKARREEALRARGLLPPKPIKYLSEMEAELDARRMPLAPPDAGASQAKEIVEMWRKSNMFTLEEERTSTEPSDAHDSPTTLGQDIQVTGHCAVWIVDPTITQDVFHNVASQSSLVPTSDIADKLPEIPLATSFGFFIRLPIHLPLHSDCLGADACIYCC
ncbi:hypothetical protein EWM64_g472 [Hericium alpestre]|uniref:Uncharacterized protein n=1 Tax=Hericium alpestre TaxID=135208 RepID=A0A4Z0A9Y4_9AGAM|nr:hypothetical protein EWM64_g472 [Hericium alpestre]